MDDKGIPSDDGDCVPNVQAKSKAGLSLVSSEERGGIVSARGTGDGLILRLDGRVRLHDLKKAIDSFMESRESFISGNSVAIEWTGSFPGEVFIEELSDHLQEQYRISVKSSCLKGARPNMDDTAGQDKTLSLFDGVGNIQIDTQSQLMGSQLMGSQLMGSQLMGSGAMGDSSLAAEIDTSALFDDADARIMLTTLRSGQRMETEHSVVICGDVNFGAEVVAGGDVIVLGTLRGVAHAGAFDETGGGRFIFSLDLSGSRANR